MLNRIKTARLIFMESVFYMARASKCSHEVRYLLYTDLENPYKPLFKGKDSLVTRAMKESNQLF